MTYFWPILASLLEAGFIIALVYILWWLVTAPDGFPVSAKLTFQGVQMPATIRVGKTATAVFTEFDANGVVVPPVTAPVFSSATPAVATVDPASGVVTGVSAGTSVISGSDSGDGLNASDTITVTDPATTATLVLTAN